MLIWGEARLLDRQVTDGVGRFASDAPSDRVRRISAHHLGFSSAVVSGPVRVGAVVSMLLEPLPVVLPEINVLVTADVCSGEPSERARSLWWAASKGYAKDTGLRGGLAAGHNEHGPIRSDELGSLRSDRLVPRVSRWRGATPGRTLEDRVASAGYAWSPAEGSSLDRRHFNWSYPRFEDRHAYHFATPEFGDGHDFHLLRITSSAGWEVAYCPRERESTWLQGRITIGSDSTLVAATWSVRTEEPFENAGGELVFGDALDPEGARHLVAARGVFWRHDGNETMYPTLPRTYHQILRVNTEWIVSTDAELPDCRPRWCSVRDARRE